LCVLGLSWLYRKFRLVNPPLLKAAKRYHSAWRLRSKNILINIPSLFNHFIGSNILIIFHPFEVNPSSY
jgi:hypothetical protein